MKNAHQASFGTDASISFGTQILIFLVVSVTSIIIARTLGPQGKGIYSLVITIPAIMATLINMGINSSNIYFIGKKRYPIGLVVGNAFFYSFCVGSIISLLLIILVPFFAVYFLKDAPRAYLYLTLPMIPFLLVFENIYYILLGYRRMLKLAVVSLAKPIVYLAILVVFYYFLGITIYRAVLANIFGLLAPLGIGIYFFARSGYLFKLAVNKEIFREALNFGCKEHLGTIAQFFNYRLDLLIIAVLLSPKEVGLYSVAVLIAEIVWYIPKSLGFVLYPQTASSDAQTANRFTPFVCRNTVLLTFLAASVLYSISGLVIPWLFTSQFLPSVMALKLLLPGIFFLSISKVLGSDLTGRGLPQYYSFASLISLLLTVSLDLLLIPRFGINGASIASSLAYMIHAFIVLYLFRRISGVRLFDILVFKFKDFVVYQKKINLCRDSLSKRLVK